MAALQRYDLGRRIAAGGMGEVFVAKVFGPHGFTKTVAVKRLLKRFAEDPEFNRRFIREATLAVSLTHANLVQVLDLVRSEDQLLLVMEYVHGADLRTIAGLLRREGEAVPLPLVIHFMTHALQGLAYAHELTIPSDPTGIIHCDISASNLLISYAGEVKIADFGIARGIATARPNQPIMGKPAYMSPEQLRGDPLDGRADLYSLGVLAKKLLDCGDGPAEQEALDARFFNLPLPQDFKDLVNAATAEDREDRPASAREMLSGLTDVAQRIRPFVTAPEVGSWLRDLIPPQDSADQTVLSRPIPQPLNADTLIPEASLILPRTVLDRGKIELPPRAPTLSIRMDRTDASSEAVAAPPPRSRFRGAAVLSAMVSGLLLAGALVGVPFSFSDQVSPMAVAEAPVVLAPQDQEAPIATPAAPDLATAAETSTTSLLPVSAVLTPPEPASPSSANTVVKARPQAKGTASRGRRQGVGRLNVFADPWAHVAVDGRPVGTAPLMGIKLSEGQHRVLLKHPGAPPISKTVVVRAGETTLLEVTMGL